MEKTNIFSKLSQKKVEVIVFFNYYVQHMSNYFISQLLVCMLMLLALLRILISNRKQEDSLIIFAPAAFFMSLVLVPAFGLTLPILLLIAESTLILIVNIPSLNRYSQKLYIDSFSPAYITFTGVLSILFILLTVFIFLNRPVPEPHTVNNPAIPNINRTVYRMRGTHSAGFEEGDRLFFIPDAVFYTVEITDGNNSKPVVILLPDVYTTFSGNEATVSVLTKKQNTVVCGDFFCKDGNYTNKTLFNRHARSLFLQYLNYKADPVITNSQNYWKNLKKSELKALLSFVQQHYADRKLIVVADGLSGAAAKEYLDETKNPAALVELDNSIPGYIPGFGNYAVIEPLLYTKRTVEKTNGWIQAEQIALKVEQLK